MRTMHLRGGLLAGLALVALLVSAPAGSAAGGKKGTEALTTYLSNDGEAYVGIRPTSVGLPQIGIEGTVGAGELAYSLSKYQSSGLYARDLRLVGQAAKDYLKRRLDDDAKPVRRVKTCKTRYRRVRSGTHEGFYRRSRRCATKRVAPERINGKPAILLDIDETSLSNYPGMYLGGFMAVGSVLPIALGVGQAIEPTVQLYRYARSRGVAVFFVTGRPDIARIPTEANLKAVGFPAWDGLEFKPSGLHTEEYKAGARAAIEKRGYVIVANVGDQESDLDGGHAERAFKYPNPFYFVSD